MFVADTPAAINPCAIASTTGRRDDSSEPDCVSILMPTTSAAETKCRHAVVSSFSLVKALMPAVTIARAFAASTAKLLTALESRTKTTRLFAETIGGELVSAPRTLTHRRKPASAGVRMEMETLRRMAGSAAPLKLHREQELRVGTRLLELLGDEFHRFDWRNACQGFAQDVDAVEFVRMIEQLFLTRAAPLDIDRGKDAFLDEVTVQTQLHVARALELFKNNFIHARARFHEGGCDD